MNPNSFSPDAGGTVKVRTAADLALERCGVNVPPLVAGKPTLTHAATLVYPDGTSEVVTLEMLARWREATKLLERAEQDLAPYRRGGESWRAVLRRMVKFYKSRNPDRRNYFVAAFEGGTTFRLVNGIGGVALRTNLEGALREASHLEGLAGRGKTIVLQEIPTSTRVEVKVLPDDDFA